MQTSPWVVRAVALVVILHAAVVVAVLTPTTDALSMVVPWLMTSVVSCALFELGRLLYRRRG